VDDVLAITIIAVLYTDHLDAGMLALALVPSFDAKAELPSPTKNPTLATDVAAMSADGGVLLYGVGDDEHGRPTVPKPIALAAVASSSAARAMRASTA
jgi:hypothetical protein